MPGTRLTDPEVEAHVIYKSLLRVKVPKGIAVSVKREFWSDRADFESIPEIVTGRVPSGLDLLVSERSVCEPSFLWVAAVPYQALHTSDERNGDGTLVACTTSYPLFLLRGCAKPVPHHKYKYK